MSKEYSDLYKTDNYDLGANYVLDSVITEYDMAKANISILRSLNMISQQQYDKFDAMPKLQRSITIGKMIGSDKNLSDALMNGFVEYRHKLFEANKIQDAEVFAIKRDAVYIMNRSLLFTDFEYVHFRRKNTYSSYFKINSNDFYYGYDENNKEILDIKGIGDEVIHLHEDYMLRFIKIVLYEIQFGSPAMAGKIIRGFEQQYCNYELPSGYYRTLDSTSQFRSQAVGGKRVYTFDTLLRESEKTYLDISYNHKYITDLYKICSTIYFSKKGR